MSIRTFTCSIIGQDLTVINHVHRSAVTQIPGLKNVKWYRWMNAELHLSCDDIFV